MLSLQANADKYNIQKITTSTFCDRLLAIINIAKHTDNNQSINCSPKSVQKINVLSVYTFWYHRVGTIQQLIRLTIHLLE